MIAKFKEKVNRFNTYYSVALNHDQIKRKGVGEEGNLQGEDTKTQ